MELIKGIKVVDLALVIGKTLVLGDVHIGYEEALNKQGVLIPRFQYADIVNRIESILGSGTFDTIVINGDLKHEFGVISRTEWKQTLDILQLLETHCKKIVLVRGNHDKILEPIARVKNLTIVDEYVVNDIYICHGHKIPTTAAFKKAKVVVIGHEHPAVNLDSGVRVEKYKCYLLGTYRAKKLIVMPSFNLVGEGTDVLKDRLLSPFLKDINSFKVYVVGDKIYDFGKVSKLRTKW
jgi:hypothetical protein